MPLEVTKAEVLEAAARGDGVLGRTQDDEPIFVMTGRDPIAPLRVDAWATLAEAHGFHEKAAAARLVADRMRSWRAKQEQAAKLAGSMNAPASGKGAA
jgi:hypothetical protein